VAGSSRCDGACCGPLCCAKAGVQAEAHITAAQTRPPSQRFFRATLASSIVEETFDSFPSSFFWKSSQPPELRGILIDSRLDFHVGRSIGMDLHNEATQLLDVIQELVDKPVDPLNRVDAPRVRGRPKLQCWFDHRPAPYVSPHAILHANGRTGSEK
jgi:hypothetical protein